MKTPSSSSSSPVGTRLHAAETLPPNLSEWLAFGRQLTGRANRTRAGARASQTQPSQRLVAQTETAGTAVPLLPRATLLLALLASLAAPLRGDSLWKDDAGPTMLCDKKAIAVG
ncbi:MAG: hypothetical protein HZA92_11730, partial [Verrucomicrobia bacterium]|nr:hypothetical protein [Verrucomicrobiota bacterium]